MCAEPAFCPAGDVFSASIFDRVAQAPRRQHGEQAQGGQHDKGLVEGGQACRAAGGDGQLVAVRGQTPFQHDATQADTSGATQHAGKIDGACALGAQVLGQPAHGAQVERGQNEAQANPAKDAKSHHDPQLGVQPHRQVEQEGQGQQQQAGADQQVCRLSVRLAPNHSDGRRQHETGRQQQRAHQ